jgi:MerR family transcriptional regulator, heat shock protein HspR
MPDTFEEDGGYFVISVAARVLNVHPQTLRYYERAGLIRPSRSKGNIRMYSTRDLQHVREIKELIEVYGVNLAGVEVILRLMERMRQLEEENARIKGTADREHVPEGDSARR